MGECAHRDAERTGARYGGISCDDPEIEWECPDCGRSMMLPEGEEPGEGGGVADLAAAAEDAADDDG